MCRLVFLVIFLCAGLLLGGLVHAQDLPFGLTFEVEGEKEGVEATLVMDLDLFQKEDWVVSTHSTDSMFGKVDVRFLDLPLLMPAGELTERPESTWEVEHFSQLAIRVLRQDTEMRLPVRATSDRDFEAMGQVFFVLEPLCMPFEVDFTVGRREGVWTVERTGGRQAWFPESD
jgi:hypothetical protein